MQADMHDDELKGTNRAERCRERSSDTEEPGRGCKERAAEEGRLGTSRGSCDLNGARQASLPSFVRWTC